MRPQRQEKSVAEAAGTGGESTAAQRKSERKKEGQRRKRKAKEVMVNLGRADGGGHGFIV
jgi:hypothetical protein